MHDVLSYNYQLLQNLWTTKIITRELLIHYLSTLITNKGFRIKGFPFEITLQRFMKPTRKSG